MKNLTILVVLSLSVLSTGCATLSSERGKYSVNGVSGNPIAAMAVAGQVNDQQAQTEICREQMKVAAERGVMFNPASCTRYNVTMASGYGGGYGAGPAGYWGQFGAMTDQNFNLGGIAGIPWQATGGMQYGGTTVVTQPADGVSHADLQRVEEKADDSLRMHAKTRDLLKKIAK